jgi:hypothetical protein
MHITSALHTELRDLGDQVGVPELPVAVQELIDACAAAVPSCLALRVTSPALGPSQVIETDGISTVFGAARASLRLDLLSGHVRVPPGLIKRPTVVRVLLLAGNTGAFDDFVGGGDALDRQGFRIVRRTVDEDLSAPGDRAWTGEGLLVASSDSVVPAARTINRAVGVLIDRGHLPDDALELLNRQASTADRTVLEHARTVLQSTARGGDGH